MVNDGNEGDKCMENLYLICCKGQAVRLMSYSRWFFV
jgi:hypothetical protein